MTHHLPGKTGLTSEFALSTTTSPCLYSLFAQVLSEVNMLRRFSPPLPRREAYIKTVFAVNQQQYSILSFLPSRKKLIPRGSRAAPPPLPLPEYIEMKDRCKIEYVDIQPKTDNTTDKPGLLWCCMALQEVIKTSATSFRWCSVRSAHRWHQPPGYEGSTVAKSHYLESSALPTAQLTFDALQQLTSTSESVFLLDTHSAHKRLSTWQR
ncbi:hypothetical protein GQ600_12118 [Phytophthora cactorum]|nr:hypothetical protein GQ600_12118 [Phytophthora cactorum]